MIYDWEHDEPRLNSAHIIDGDGNEHFHIEMLDTDLGIVLKHTYPEKGGIKRHFEVLRKPIVVEFNGGPSMRFP